MVLTGIVLLCLAALWLGAALLLMWWHGLSLAQAALYAPMKLLWRVGDRDLREARKAGAPVIYVVVHRSRLDPALMLALLPQDTLHILDPYSANAGWLEPFRDLARTIAFNARHVFVSRRLVRVLKGKGRLAVYLPDEIEPDLRSFRLYRAISRIALKADARIVPLFIDGAARLSSGGRVRHRLFPRLAIRTLPALTIDELIERRGWQPASFANTLFDRVAEARLGDTGTGLFHALKNASDKFGARRVAVEDAVSGPLGYGRLLSQARLLAGRFAQQSAPGEPTGLMLPNSCNAAAALLGLWSAGRPAALLDPAAEAATILAAVRTAALRMIVTSRAFADESGIADKLAVIERSGARLLYLEDQLRAGWLERRMARLLRRVPVVRRRGEDPAALLFPQNSGDPEPVVLTHRNLLAGARQIEARIALAGGDRFLNLAPMADCFGLTAGMLVPLLAGIPVFMGRHDRPAAEAARKASATVLVAGSAVLDAPEADRNFSGLRLVLSGQAPLGPDALRQWRGRTGAKILTGYAPGEGVPLATLNTSLHGREGSIGRLLPGMRLKIAAAGKAKNGRFRLAGPNLAFGVTDEEGWLDTGEIASIDRDGFITLHPDEAASAGG